MSWQVNLSPSVQRDIAQVIEWTQGKFGYRQAVRYHAMIESTLRNIALDPYCVGSRPHELLTADIRVLRLMRGTKRGQHRLVYRVDDGQRVVNIARLLHVSMELVQHIPDDFLRDNF